MLRPKLSQFVFVCCLCLLAALSQYFSLFNTLDLVFYDSAQHVIRFEPAEDILIVEIDERSMEKLGAWPWSRQAHAKLLDSLTELGVSDVAFDVIFSEERSADVSGDLAFSEAIARHGRVVLPIFISALSSPGAMFEVPPAPIFYKAKPTLGHVHVGCDDDAICRSVYLKEGLGDPHWPHISLALLQQQRFQKKLPGMRSTFDGEYSSKLIYRDYQNYYRFPKIDSGFARVSYWDIISGYYSPGQFEGHTAFVGSTVSGLGDDEISTPVGSIPGVVLNAVIYQQLRSDNLITGLNPITAALVTLCLGVLMLSLLSRLSPAAFLLSTLLALFVVYGVMVFALFTLQIWIPVASLFLLVVAYYPLWNWFKLQQALNFLHSQLDSLSGRNALARNLFSAKALEKDFSADRDGYGVEVVTDTLHRLRSVYQYVEEQRLVIENTLASIREALLLAEEDGTLVLSNKIANTLLGIDSQTTLSSLSTSLSMMKNSGYDSWDDYVNSVREGKRIEGVEIKLRNLFGTDGNNENERMLFCHGQLSVFDTGGLPQKNMLILTFSDISPLKRAERLRIDTLNFLSHDLRAPMVSILALISNIRSGRNQNTYDENLDKIKAYTESNLSYSESILQLGRAEEANVDRFDLVDVHNLVDSAYYSVYDFAKSKQIDLRIERQDRDFWVNGDADLLERAIVNLISNGVKYSDNGGEVLIGIAAKDGMVSISVKDLGQGIDKAEIAHIFSRYKRGGAVQTNLGAGLGLYFVKTVMLKHGGEISVESEIGQGSCFVLLLPTIDPDSDSAD